MRHIAISVISLFIVLPASAAARLPVVNLAAGGVSARAAFGEDVTEKSTSAPSKRVQPVVASNTQGTSAGGAVKSEKSNRNVVARAAAPRASVVTAKPVQTDSGEQIIASADILSPRRPSADLWARASSVSNTSDEIVPLRLPTPDEFAVFRSDSVLPEESLDSKPSDASPRVASTVSAPASDARARSASVSQTASAPLSELDAQIARLNELQRRADESVRDDVIAPAAPRVVSETRGVVSRSATVARSANDVPAVAARSTMDEDVKLSRMVVPMDDLSDDVVVRAVQRAESPRIATVRNDMTQMSPSELRRAFRKTFLSENKHLSTFQIDDRFDVASDMTANAAGFTSARDLSEAGGIRPLEIKIKFRNEDAALSRDNYNLLTEYAGIVLSNPTRAVQVSIPQNVTTDSDARKLAARRLAIIEQVLRDNGISEQRILPVLSQRDEEGLVLRMISLDQYETLTKQQRDIFGDTVSKKTYRSMSW